MDIYKTFKDLKENILIEDCDVYNKLTNLSDGDEISEVVYDCFSKNSDYQKQIAEYIIDWVKSDVHAEEILNDEMEQFCKWYDEEELEKYGFESALYNCDSLYLDAMNSILQKGKRLHEVGICPVCGKVTLEYGTMEVYGESVLYPWNCGSCASEGKEVYDLIFAGHEDISII